MRGSLPTVSSRISTIDCSCKESCLRGVRVEKNYFLVDVKFELTPNYFFFNIARVDRSFRGSFLNVGEKPSSPITVFIGF